MSGLFELFKSNQEVIAMMDGICGSGGLMGQMQMKGMGQRSSPAEKFSELDVDGNGAIDTKELAVLTDGIAAKTGEAINVEEASAAYDANNDGLLEQDEMQAMLTEMRGKMGNRPPSAPPPQQSLAAYEANVATENDLASMLMEMIGEGEEEQASYTPLSIEV